MSDQQLLKDNIEQFHKIVEEKRQLVKEAAEKVATVRQVQTESPSH